MSKTNDKSSDTSQKEPERKTIKYGILSQTTDIINIKELFNIYFEKSQVNIIKNNEKSYEFSFNENDKLSFYFGLIPENEYVNLFKIYSYFHFFLVFIDIQTTESLNVLESIIDRLIDCSEENIKKSYIFGVYKNENIIANKDERITTLLNTKGVDYEYSEININLHEDFPKGMEYLVEDSKDLMEEIEFEELHNKNGRDKGKSCQIV
jgi:hypothetical protein